MSNPLIDSFGRRISYVRLSVTDRCDLRCRYCMSEKMQFVPRSQLLSLSEMADLSSMLIQRGVRRIRLTGGEPLVRRDIIKLIEDIGAHIGHGLDELTLTTNGTQLGTMAAPLYAAGVRRVNVSLDSLNADQFHMITRNGDLSQVLNGLTAAKEVGLKVKINMVALKGMNEDEIEPMLRWCGAQGYELTLIEAMPLGETGEDRTDHYMPLDNVRDALARQYLLVPSLHRTGGPARYYDVPDLKTRIGFITPHSNNFCTGCNRIRITATGTVFGCLGQDQQIDLRDVMRSEGAAGVSRILDEVMLAKPKGHDFDITANRPAVARHMSVTGG